MDSLRNNDEEDEAMEEDIDSGDEKQAKIRRHLTVCYDKVFESALAILPTSGFIKVVKQLLGRDQPANIQRKALEVLNARFGQKELANPNIPAILQCLARLAMTENKESSNVDNKGKELTPWIDYFEHIYMQKSFFAGNHGNHISYVSFMPPFHLNLIFMGMKQFVFF